MNRLLRWIFTLCVAYPVVLVWLGVSVANRKNLPLKGPAIVIANHNSHLDVLTLFTLFPLSALTRVHPVAAADYFLNNRLMAWFALKVIGIIPVRRGGSGKNNPLAGCIEALRQEKIIILFPEGTRGEPECFSEFKSGLWHLNREMPEVPIIPVYMRGLGRAMGKGQKIPVPFFIDIWVDEPMSGDADKGVFQERLLQRFVTLQKQAEGRKS
ncbi:lysophospholipid acyltransferase family protein [Enterobacillus tribolii]|uniref:1-acyl-sn-glycerol-3-phosphate acyltransferase n=1 Tax=Enterobacillus tribolii TaxID=1487935 RepID=A0A370R4X8_9GAMM|nr:lysophospholipid acyltransferase family protein [Enterobacillus tribolii]MBW7983418.1 1-acyl-sn-glycerol-3-phosphate acyltransferase [Enterobacillus tribolii]RDK97478.1 1-acyl-sn-glycerol-3-phosphate acyltransferase [Enterobacillus tribolii]